MKKCNSSANLAQKFKEDGNKAFSEGDYHQAIEIYTKSLEALNDVESDLSKVELCQKRAILELNVSICYYRLGKLKESLTFAEKAIENNPEYVKALYRKAIIMKDMKNFEESIMLAKRIMTIEPMNKEAQDLLKNLRKQLVEEDNENKNPILLLEKELQQKDVELSLKKYKQYLLESIDTTEEAIKFYQKFKLNEVFLKHVHSELRQSSPNLIRISYLMRNNIYFCQTLFGSLFGLQNDKKPSETEAQLIDIFNSLNHNQLLIEIYGSFTGLALKSEALSFKNKIQENFIKLFRFAHFVNMTEQDGLNNMVSTLTSLLKFYGNAEKEYVKLVLATITECFQLNIATYKKPLTQDESIFDSPLILMAESLSHYFKDKKHISNYGCFVVVFDFYLKIQGIKNYEEFKKSLLFQHKISDELFLIYSLLVANTDIGSKHFSNLLNNQNWEDNFLNDLSDSNTNIFQRKLAFEIINLFIKDIEGCKDLLTRKVFLETLIKIVGTESQPLFQLKVIVLLVKLVLRQPTNVDIYPSEVVQQFEKILDVDYLAGLFDYLITNKEMVTIFKNEILEFVELILGLSYVDDFKVKLSKIPVLFEVLNKLIGLKFEKNEQQNSLNLAILLFFINMLSDAKQESLLEQKKKFDIQDEDLQKLENLINSSNQGQTFIPKYTSDYIKASEIPTRILGAINLENFCRAILDHAEFLKSSKLLRVNLPKLFIKLNSRAEKDKALLLRKDIIRVCLLIWDKSNEPDIKEDIAKFLSGVLVTCNPNMFTFTDAIQIVDILVYAITRSSHELTIFEATLSLVQFSSENEDVCKRILQKHSLWSTLVLNLCEENDYIVHATLELINNLSLSETLQTLYSNLKTTDRECKVIKAVLRKYYESTVKPLLAEQLNTATLNQSNLFSNYNGVFQKLSLLVGIPAILNFKNEFIAFFNNPEELYGILGDICTLLLKIHSFDSKFFNKKSRREIFSFFEKLSLLTDKSWMRNVVSEPVKKILLPNIKEFSQNECSRLNELLKM